MKILGISGGMDMSFENEYNIPLNICHDASASLIVDGKVVAAIEEERLNRIKHSSKAPFNSIQFVLESADLTIDDIDKICYYSEEDLLDSWQKFAFYGHSQKGEYLSVRGRVKQLVETACDKTIDESKIEFVNHHHAHAMCSYAMSGFENSLVFSLDAQGDNLSGMMLLAEGTEFKEITRYPVSQSLGRFYVGVIKYLGYSQFDEYKVMGLAPYGDAEKYKFLFQKAYTLLPGGKYEIYLDRIDFLSTILMPRRKQDPFLQIHKDIAAALQVALEDIVFHVVKYYQKSLNQKYLCLSGGVAHNCVMTGKLRASGIFKDVFVHPAAHDAGCSIGAALVTYYKYNPAAKMYPIENVYWGTDAGSNDYILKVLEQWKDFIEFEYYEEIESKTAELINENFVIGWVQGKSEFGPRALGNRSIIADPRPAENKEIINQMVKKREGYRPFAPSVLEEKVDEYFHLPYENKSIPFMNFVVDVKHDKREFLGAIVHVDGSARVQTVNEKQNPRYWKLINCFYDKTGLPLILNTSYNNHKEPIVNTVLDAMICYLTTGLHYMVAGNYLIKKRDIEFAQYLDLIISLPTQMELNRTRKFNSLNSQVETFEIRDNYLNTKNKSDISNDLFNILVHANGQSTINEIIEKNDILTDKSKNELGIEVFDLLENRLIKLEPGLNEVAIMA